MQFTLTDEEREALLTTVNSAYPELRDEISNTGPYELRELLKRSAMTCTMTCTTAGSSRRRFGTIKSAVSHYHD